MDPPSEHKYRYYRKGDYLYLEAMGKHYFPTHFDPVDDFMYFPLGVDGHKANTPPELEFVSRVWDWGKTAKNKKCKWKMPMCWSERFKTRVSKRFRAELGDWLDYDLG